ncbi:DUF6908 domain-containing protein [Flavobacterium lindanitolerans]|uniref:DUF6908 domain-containing protein n=1 Tax=Flavobacterium lindanitolerans TaxID=428988 RepID=UPI0023F4DDE8|nr:hypothetical protein [Flavobacterium lindanitolerans]
MKNLNKISTIILCKLLDNMGDHSALSIENPPHLTLTLEEVQRGIYLSKIPDGVLATLYSLRQSYIDLDEKEVVETEMYFAISGYGTSRQGDKMPLLAVPYCYQSNRLNRKETSMWLSDRRRPSIAPKKQEEHVRIAEEWFENIFAEGYLDALI